MPKTSNIDSNKCAYLVVVPKKSGTEKNPSDPDICIGCFCNQYLFTKYFSNWCVLLAPERE